MSKTKEIEAPKMGRKRDETLDSQIVEAAINILAEVGFDKMTMDMVAASVGAGKASLYRRWPSKAELIRDALIEMSKGSVELMGLPDTGNVRDDLLALIKPYSSAHAERKLRVLNNLGSFLTAHRELSDEATSEIFGAWTKMNRALLVRAIERKEIDKKADIDMFCQIVVAMTSYYTLQLRKSFDKKTYGELLDKVLLPAMKS